MQSTSRAKGLSPHEPALTSPSKFISILANEHDSIYSPQTHSLSQSGSTPRVQVESAEGERLTGRCAYQIQRPRQGNSARTGSGRAYVETTRAPILGRLHQTNTHAFLLSNCRFPSHASGVVHLVSSVSFPSIRTRARSLSLTPVSLELVCCKHGPAPGPIARHTADAGMLSWISGFVLYKMLMNDSIAYQSKHSCTLASQAKHCSK